MGDVYTCLRKKAYASKKRAKQVAVWLIKHGMPRQKPYLCEYCGHYHLTSWV